MKYLLLKADTNAEWNCPDACLLPLSPENMALIRGHWAEIAGIKITASVISWSHGPDTLQCTFGELDHDLMADETWYEEFDENEIVLLDEIPAFLFEQEYTIDDYAIKFFGSSDAVFIITGGSGNEEAYTLGTSITALGIHKATDKCDILTRP